MSDTSQHIVLGQGEISEKRTCNCPVILVGLAVLIAATGIATGAIYGWMAGALAYFGLWLAVFVALFFRVRHG